MSPWIHVIIICAIVGGLILVIASRARTMMRLMKRGTPIQATVIDKRRRQRGGGVASAWLKYEFHARGQIYRRGVHVSEEVFDAHEVGSPINISYDQQNPKINAAQYMVDQTKKAYEKKRG